MFGALLSAAPFASAQTPPAASAVETPLPAKVDELIRLLSDPAIKNWLAHGGKVTNVTPDANAPPAAGIKNSPCSRLYNAVRR